jgi:hypothetical protein
MTMFGQVNRSREAIRERSTNWVERSRICDLDVQQLRVSWRLKPQLYKQSPPTRTDIQSKLSA